MKTERFFVGAALLVIALFSTPALAAVMKLAPVAPVVTSPTPAVIKLAPVAPVVTSPTPTVTLIKQVPVTPVVPTPIPTQALQPVAKPAAAINFKTLYQIQRGESLDFSVCKNAATKNYADATQPSWDKYKQAREAALIAEKEALAAGKTKEEAKRIRQDTLNKALNAWSGSVDSAKSDLDAALKACQTQESVRQLESPPVAPSVVQPVQPVVQTPTETPMQPQTTPSEAKAAEQPGFFGNVYKSIRNFFTAK